MRMNTCTLPRMQALRIGFVLLAASLSLLPLSAQNARIHESGAQANLRIEVKVVPAVAVHHRDNDNDKDKDKNRDRKDGAAVTYNLNPQPEELSVIEEMRPMLVDSSNNAIQEQVRTITVVPK